ncbi:hypothetical protein TNCT_690441, partial [Trichonephila clavata]
MSAKVSKSSLAPASKSFRENVGLSNSAPAEGLFDYLLTPNLETM